MKVGPLISIIMPAFNEEQFIQESINSVLNQTYDNWELLVIDDGSTDKTNHIVSNINHARISLHAMDKNCGVSTARNIGLERSHGHYITFLDADDILPPQSLKSRLDVFRSNPKASFVDGQILEFDSSMSNQLGKWTPTYRGRPFDKLIALDGSCFYGLTWMIKRSGCPGVTFDQSMTHSEDLLYLMQTCYGTPGEYNFTNQVTLHRRTGHESAMDDLFGLELGYKEICKRIEDFNNVSDQAIEHFRKKVQSIMFKSYLRQFNLKGIFRVLGPKWYKH